MLSILFRLKQHNTSIRREAIAGVTTFFSMAYIAVLMPNLLGNMGMDTQALFVTTCVVCIFGGILMGLIANLPVTIAPAVAIIAYFTTVVVQTNHLSWQQAMLAVFVAAVGLVIVTAFHLQRKIVTSLPQPFFNAICAGLGLFLIIIALNNSQIISLQGNIFSIRWQPWSPPSWIFLLSLVITIALDRLHIIGNFIIAIIIATAFALLTGLSHYHGLFSLPPHVQANLLQFDWNAIHNPIIWHAAICLLLVTLLDNTGTLVGLTQTLDHLDNQQMEQAVSKGVIANALSTLFASLLSSPCTSTYLESATGIRAGGKTGLTSSITALCFVLLLFFSPLVATVPPQATSAIILYIGFLMFSKIRGLHFKEFATTWGSLVTIVLIPMCLSVAEGLSGGLVVYSLLSCCHKKTRDTFNKRTIWLTVLLVLFLLFFHFSQL